MINVNYIKKLAKISISKMVLTLFFLLSLTIVSSAQIYDGLMVKPEIFEIPGPSYTHSQFLPEYTQFYHKEFLLQKIKSIEKIVTDSSGKKYDVCHYDKDGYIIKQENYIINNIKSNKIELQKQYSSKVVYTYSNNKKNIERILYRNDTLITVYKYYYNNKHLIDSCKEELNVWSIEYKHIAMYRCIYDVTYRLQKTMYNSIEVEKFVYSEVPIESFDCGALNEFVNASNACILANNLIYKYYKDGSQYFSGQYSYEGKPAICFSELKKDNIIFTFSGDGQCNAQNRVNHKRTYDLTLPAEKQDTVKRIFVSKKFFSYDNTVLDCHSICFNYLRYNDKAEVLVYEEEDCGRWATNTRTKANLLYKDKLIESIDSRNIDQNNEAGHTITNYYYKFYRN